MRKNTVLPKICILCFFLLAATPVLAGPLTLTPPTGNYYGGGAGQSRGDIIEMTGDYVLTSIGIDAIIYNNAELTFTAYVYDVSNGDGNNALAIGTPTLVTGNGSAMWYDVPISFTLLSGGSYDIGIDFGYFNHPDLWPNYYHFNYPTDSPFSVGPVTVVDGEHNHSSSNSLTPNLRLNGSSSNTVPEPTTLFLLSTGLGLVWLTSLKRRK